MSGSIEIRDDGPVERLGRFARERLEIAFPPRLFMHAYMPSRVTPQVWTELLRRTPFVGLGWAKLGPKPGTPANQYRAECTWSAFLVVRNPNGQEARMFGDRQGPGMFKMIRAAIAVLHGAALNGVGTLQVTDAGHGFMEGYEKDDISMGAVDFLCDVNISLAGTLRGITAPALEEIGITWSFAGDAADALSDTNQTGAT
jgi:hypothetical protein